MKMIFDSKKENYTIFDSGKVMVFYNENVIEKNQCIIDNYGNPKLELKKSYEYDVEIFKSDKKDYDGIVESLRNLMIQKINSYDKSDNVNTFYLNGTKMSWIDKDTRVGLMLRFNAEKSAGKTETTLWSSTQCITGNIDSLIQMMYALEVYASACYDNTAQHKASVYALNIVSEIVNYDFTAGYPAMLRFNL